MAIFTALLLLAAGLVVLTAGARCLIYGASSIALRIGISQLVIGLTVVAFGTSAPELAVSLRSVYAGQPEIAIGNVVGSSIFNILFILGLSAALRPLVVQQQLIRFDTPLMLIVSLAVLVLSADGRIERLNGILMFTCLILYLFFLIRSNKRQISDVLKSETDKAVQPSFFRTNWRLLADLFSIVLGLGMLVLGGQWCLDASVSLARGFGVSELVIGLTIVACGTSLPEIATSVVASMQNKGDIALGNVVGSNIFNLLFVLGLTAIASPNGLEVSPHAANIDMVVMVVSAALCLPMMYTGKLISRCEGLLLFSGYLAYVGFLYFGATGSF